MASKAILSGLPKEEAWPALPLAEWNATRDTLHMWMQMVGKAAPGAQPARKSLVGGAALRERAGPDDFRDSLPAGNLRSRV